MGTSVPLYGQNFLMRCVAWGYFNLYRNYEQFWSYRWQKQRPLMLVKAVPFQPWKSPKGSRKFWFPDFVTAAQDGGRLSALRPGRLYPQKILLVIISIRSWVDPRAIDFMSMKNPLIPAGIEPATFWFVAQHLNHCATAVPIDVSTLPNNSWSYYVLIN